MILYKYYPCDKYSIASLAVKGLWCHHATKMNDPFECLWTIDRKFDDNLLSDFKDFSRQAKNKTLKDLSSLDNVRLTEFINKVRKESIKKYAFCSLSTNTFDILMWSHYADSHRGITVGFEFDDFHNRKIFQEVNYVDKLGNYDLMSWAKFIDGEDELMVDFLQDISVKSHDWTSEKEWRIWTKEPCYYNYKSHEIKEINFGINCPDETKAIVAKVVQLHDDIKLFEMETSNDPFKLVR